METKEIVYFDPARDAEACVLLRDSLIEAQGWLLRLQDKPSVGVQTELYNADQNIKHAILGLNTLRARIQTAIPAPPPVEAPRIQPLTAEQIEGTLPGPPKELNPPLDPPQPDAHKLHDGPTAEPSTQQPEERPRLDVAQNT